ncbi:MAG: ABC transporter permease, partial [Cyclobacteriaceae bacterium]
KIAIRNFSKQKLYSFINVFGLALGITCVLLLTLFVLNEQSFDRFHAKQNQIHRVVQKVSGPDGTIIEHSSSIPWAVGPALQTDYPDVPNVRMYKAWQKSPLMKYEGLEKGFYEKEVFFVDTSFFNIFSFPLVKGNPATALQTPQSVVLTESTAFKYFGDEDPLGKTIKLENSLDLTVTGVAKDVPPNSHFHFDFLIPLLNIGDIFQATGNNWGWTGWYWNPVHTYVLLPERYSGTDFNGELKKFVAKNFPEGLREQNELYTQPLNSIHLHSTLYQEIEPGRSESSIQIAISIAAFILLIASINFVNLTTARSTQRAKEVGMRKVMGSTRNKLIAQFFSESILVCLLSFALSFFLIALFLPAFETLVNAHLNLAYLVTPRFVLIVISSVLLLGVAAGLYPALLLSSYQPVKILKSTSSGSAGGFAALFRKSLVVLQFTISVVLVVSTIIIYKQHHFLTEKNLGFKKDEIVMIPIQGTVIKGKRTEFKNELKNNSQVVAACAISDILGQDVPNRPFGIVGYDGPQDTPGLFTDHDFVKTFGLNML